MDRDSNIVIFETHLARNILFNDKISEWGERGIFAWNVRFQIYHPDRWQRINKYVVYVFFCFRLKEFELDEKTFHRLRNICCKLDVRIHIISEKKEIQYLEYAAVTASVWV